MPLLSDVFVIFLSSIVPLIPNGQALDCAAIAFTERYFHINGSFRALSIFIAASAVVMMPDSCFKMNKSCVSLD
jgi:hypothetical protein